MGWASGSILLSNIISRTKLLKLDPDKAKAVYTILIDEFEDNDCDTTYECLGIDSSFDSAYYELYPDRLEDEDDYLDEEYLDEEE